VESSNAFAETLKDVTHRFSKTVEIYIGEEGSKGEPIFEPAPTAIPKTSLSGRVIEKKTSITFWRGVSCRVGCRGRGGGIRKEELKGGARVAHRKPGSSKKRGSGGSQRKMEGAQIAKRASRGGSAGQWGRGSHSCRGTNRSPAHDLSRAPDVDRGNHSKARGGQSPSSPELAEHCNENERKPPPDRDGSEKIPV